MIFYYGLQKEMHNYFWIQTEDVSLLIIFKYDHSKHIVFVF